MEISPEGTADEGMFGKPIVAQKERTLRVDSNAGLKLLGSAHFFEHEVIFAQVAPNSLAMLEKE